MIAIIVVIGLALSARSAVNQWHAEGQRIAVRLREIDNRIELAESVDERQQLEQSRRTLEKSVPRLRNLHWDRIGLSALLYAIGLLPPAMLLRSALHSLGQSPSVPTAIAAQLLGHAGKYVPGKAMVIVLRAGALAFDGVRGLPATIAVFLETFLMMAVGASLGAIVVLWLPVPSWFGYLSLAVAGAACLPTTPPVLRQVAKRITKTDDLKTRSRIDWRLFAAGWGWSLLSWLFVGASFAILITAIPSPNPLPPTPELYAIATAAICLAVVAGFASLIPGGAGVRELVLTTILGVSIGPVHGMLAAILARAVYIVVEAIMAVASWLWLRRRNSRQPKPTP
jgi:uncharacterized membrane protein YbhN (UPF0104 family)